MEDQADLEFMSDTSAAVLEGVPMTGHIILWGAFAFLVCAVAWAYYATLDEITRGEGKVIPSSDIQIVQNLEGGIVKEILAAEGQIVSKGQILMTIDDTRFASSFRESEVKRAALEAKIARLTAEAKGEALQMPANLRREFPQVVSNEESLYKQRQQEMEVRVDILKDQINEKKQELREIERRQQQLVKSHELVAKELELTYPLVAQGAVSDVDLLRLERTVNDLAGELEGNELAIPRIQSSLDGATRKVQESKITFQAEAQEQLNAAISELKGLAESSTALEDKVQRTVVRSPVRGTVNKINIKTIGGIIQPGEDVMEIVPLEDSLLIEAEIRPQDIGFLSSGMAAKIKLTAYDFSIYGGLDANVVHISADTQLNEKKENVYIIRLRTHQTFLQKGNEKLEIIPGMRASVDILTGKKTVLDYLLKPILKTKQKAMTER